MNLILKIFFIIFFLINNTFADNKVVFLDIDYVLSNSNKGKALLKILEKKNNTNIEELQSKEKILKDLEQDLEKKKNIISEQELNNQISNLKQKILIFRNDKKKLTDEFNNFKKKEISDLMKLINPIISSYVETNSINLVIDKKNILIGKKNYDITNDILELVNKNLN